MTFVAVISARLGSSRLPGKVIMPLIGLPVVRLVIRRLRTSRLLADIVLATTTNTEDDTVADAGAAEGIPVFRGSVDDVLGRNVAAARLSGADHLVRVTADCPFVSGETLDPVLDRCRALKKFDLVTTKPAYAHGIDYEVAPKVLLESISGRSDLDRSEREHMFNYVYNREADFRVVRLAAPEALAVDTDLFLMDTSDDYALLRCLTDGIDDIHVCPEALLAIAREMNPPMNADGRG